ncbi:MAG TPA: ADP-forming succinate--CoA ligase subunit beta [candidate division WOR-3 bacterium]|uniref:Succinate--CoA ligase [ADP-forming] subunit beta n=1 Tax=candidate division WOR-3 bacterium TaxID=2052148 RepID=A0A7V0T434_UNCW3|nr:ADP-forming succinate--CoA ligase subunit beta [candidate division WOR-3 bacterium]
MKVHEYQAKEIFEQAGIPVPREVVCATPAECAAAARAIGLPVVIKAQVLVGGRGKAGGVKRVEKQEQVEAAAGQILGMDIKGLRVEKVLVAECADIAKEYYVGIIVDRVGRKPVLMASAAGGVEIEQVARETPEKIVKVEIDPAAGLLGFQGRNVGMALFDGDAKLARSFAGIAARLYRVFASRDCSLIEINPLVRLGDGSLLALDAKVNFDDNALFRHPDNEAMRDRAAEEPKEVEAKEAGLSYIKLEGNVGCVVNGAGLAMATMDLIKRYGGEPANFLDVGGSSSPDKMVTAMRIILSDPNVKAILVNIFGGITRCDDIATGLLAAKKQADIRVPVVARLTGTNAEPARALLEGTDVTPAATMAEAVKKAVELAGGGK